MSDRPLSIRPASHDDLVLAISWAAAEGWNPGLHDADCFFSADSNGFFVGLLDDEPITFISAVKYGASFGFIGLYITRPEYRGRTFGTQIFKFAIESLTKRTIGLDGVLAQQDNYRRFGFETTGTNLRFEGTVNGSETRSPHVVALSELPIEQIVEFDQQFFAVPRATFLKSWIRQPDACALGYVEQGILTGYGVLRKCLVGHKIGPLLAETPDVAARLIESMLATLDPQDTFYLDTPGSNPAAIDLAKEHAMTVVFETVRMYSGPVPEIHWSGVYGITSFELG